MIYLDHNASAPLSQAASQAMQKWLTAGAHGNPASPHGAGRLARQAVEIARRQLATRLDCEAREIAFTSGATEANNLALWGAWNSPERAPHRNRIVVPATEHPAILEPARSLQKAGALLTILPVNPQGALDPKAVSQALTDDVFLFSAMAVNNETGVFHDVPALAEAAHTVGAWFHCDAAQAPTRRQLACRAWDIDFLSLSGHKVGGPQGIGALVARNSWTLTPPIQGGSQQAGRRPGTEPTALIVGMGAAFEALPPDLGDPSLPMMQASQYLSQRLKEHPEILQNSQETPHATGVFSLTFPGFNAESLVIYLDRHQIYVSTGSACASGAREPSHALLAMGLSPDFAKSTLRISMGLSTTRDEAEEFFETLLAGLEQIASVRKKS